VGCDERARFIASLIKGDLEQGRKVLCVSDRLSYLRAIRTHLGSSDIDILDGRTKEAQRADIFTKIGKGEQQILLASKAIDVYLYSRKFVGAFDALYMLTPNRTSWLGRTRLIIPPTPPPPKRPPVVRDFVDESPWLNAHFHARRRLAKREGWEIKIREERKPDGKQTELWPTQR